MNTLDDCTNNDDILQALVSQINTHIICSAELDAQAYPQEEIQDKDLKNQNKRRIKRQVNPNNRNNEFYETIIPSYTDDEFRSYFRMSRSCFARIMEKMAKKVKIYNMEKKLLFTIWMLSTRESFCAVGSRFGLAKGAAYQYFCEIIDGLVSLFKQHVTWPAETEFSHIEQGFKPKTGGYIPGIIGAIDACHIQIKKPSRYSIYCNRRNTHSIILQAVCDHQKIFTDVYVGAPGCLETQRVYQKSPLFKEIDKLVSEDYHVVGSNFFPLMKNLVVPFIDQGMLSETQMLFNDCLIKASACIDQAFRLLLARFRRLAYLDTSKPELANKMVCSCIVLHNHILMTDTDDYAEQLLQEDVELYLTSNDEEVTITDDDTDGVMKRNYLLSLFEFI